jgi:hypothetical protein
MATTTNYSWTTPDDTALVKDGAAAIRSLGTAIDTTVFNNASVAIAKTIVDAKGDLIVASGADAVARLAVGTNDHVLTADSAATNGVKWAALPASGGMTLLNSGGTALSGSSVTISSLSTSYKNLFIVWNKAYSSTNTSWGVRYNSDTGSNYYNGTLQYNTYEFNAYPNNDYNLLGSLSTNSSDKEACNGYAEIIRYADGDSKFIYSNQQFKYGASLMFPMTTWCNYDSSTAISELTFRVFSGTFSGGTVYVYGVN